MFRGLLVILIFFVSLLGSNVQVQKEIQPLLAGTQPINEISLQNKADLNLKTAKVEQNPNVNAFYSIQQLSAVSPDSLNQLLKGKACNKGETFINAGLKSNI